MSVARELRRRLQSDRSSFRLEPCLPRPVQHPPAGPGWIHEIKHDGFRILAHRRGRSVRLLTRNGNDLGDRFPLAAAAIEELPVKSCVIDGEAIVCDRAFSSTCVSLFARSLGVSEGELLWANAPEINSSVEIAVAINKRMAGYSFSQASPIRKTQNYQCIVHRFRNV
jgi:hypothetical protein